MRIYIAIFFVITAGITFLYINQLNASEKLISNIDTVYIVNNIMIIGNETTKEFIIIREMETKVGDTLKIEILKNDFNRIRNLGLFNKIDLLPVQVSDNRINLIITVEELLYIIPFPQAGFKENDIHKFWGGINFVWNNFRGRNENVSFNFGLGYEPFVGLSYSVPWVGENAHFFGSVSVRFNRNVNRTSNTNNNEQFTKEDANTYESDYYYGNITLGKFIGRFSNLSASFGYNTLEVSDNQSGRTLSPGGVDKYVFMNAAYNYNYKDDYVYTLSGTQISLSYWKYGMFGNLMDLNKIKGDFRKYIPIKLSDKYSITLALRNVFGISFGGTMPIYMLESFGSSNILRGWDDYMIQGENAIGFYTEIRIPVIQPFYVSGKSHLLLKSLPVMRDFTYKYGLYLTLFTDIGGVWNRNERFLNTQFYPGFGFGLNGTLSFNILARIDVGYRIINGKISPNYGIGLSSSF